VYDKEREDGTFTPQDPNVPSSEANNLFPSLNDGEWDPMDNIFVTMPPWHPAASGAGALPSAGKSDKERTVKNPVSHWRLSKRSVVGESLYYSNYLSSLQSNESDFVFSPDVKYVAAISEDGCLRVIDALAEQ